MAKTRATELQWSRPRRPAGPGFVAGVAAWLSLALWSPPAFAQTPVSRPAVYGAEIGLRSGHADRGFIISDRSVIQPVVWISGDLAELSVWSSFSLAETTDGALPSIVELELTQPYEVGRFTVAPAVRMFFYHDPLSLYNTRSIEGWLYLSYSVGVFRLFTNHSVDVQTYRGAYFGEAGVAFEERVSPVLELGGSVGAGWASAAFNDAYAAVATAGLDRVSVEGWLTAHVNPHLSLGPRFEFSTMVNQAVSAALARPTFLLVGLATGVEF